MDFKNKPGRPPFVPRPEMAAQVKTLAAMGIPQADIGRVLGCSGPTVRKYFGEELDNGAVEANAAVAQSMFRQATNKTKPNVVAGIFWLKCRAGWRDKDGAVGKKEERQAEAEKVAENEFRPDPPPRLVVDNTR
jgi:hypothetical protein